MAPRHRSELDPESTRERILEAAIRLFGGTGYVRTATRTIAREAGVNEVTLFRHFGSKQNLLLACLEAVQREGFVSTFEEHLTGEYAADIAIMARRQMADMVERSDVLALLFCDANQVPALREALQAGANQNAERVAGYFRRQIEAGVIRNDLNPVDLAYAFDSLFSINLLFQSLVHAGIRPTMPPDETIDALVGLFVRGTVRS